MVLIRSTFSICARHRNGDLREWWLGIWGKKTFNYTCIFPVAFQGKDFIYRGLEFEKLPSFTQRLRDEFPQASVLPYSEKMSTSAATEAEDGDGGGGDRIFVCCVQAEEEEDRPDEKSDGDIDGEFLMPAKVRQSRRLIEVRAFRHDRPVHRGKRDPDNEFRCTTNKRKIFNAQF